MNTILTNIDVYSKHTQTQCVVHCDSAVDLRVSERCILHFLFRRKDQRGEEFRGIRTERRDDKRDKE